MNWCLNWKTVWGRTHYDIYKLKYQNLYRGTCLLCSIEWLRKTGGRGYHLCGNKCALFRNWKHNRKEYLVENIWRYFYMYCDVVPVSTSSLTRIGKIHMNYLIPGIKYGSLTLFDIVLEYFWILFFILNGALVIHYFV